MKTDHWKEIFRERGWWQDGQIVSPIDCQLQIKVAGQERAIAASAIFKANEVGLAAYYESEFDEYWFYFLWEDITAVHVTKPKEQ